MYACFAELFNNTKALFCRIKTVKSVHQMQLQEQHCAISQTAINSVNREEIEGSKHTAKHSSTTSIFSLCLLYISISLSIYLYPSDLHYSFASLQTFPNHSLVPHMSFTRDRILMRGFGIMEETFRVCKSRCISFATLENSQTCYK